jgi:hypothetical protein
MGRKLVKKLSDVRRMGNENDLSFATRLEVASEILDQLPDGAKLKQNLGVWVNQDERQVPDFTVEYKEGCTDFVEIGITGSERVAKLEQHGRVIRVARNRRFRFKPQQCDCKNRK